MYPLGTTMHPRLALELTDEHIFWAGLKHHCDFRSGFKMIYGEKYAFLSLYKSVTGGPTDGRMDGRF